jgi:hypothetical protein
MLCSNGQAEQREQEWTIEADVQEKARVLLSRTVA